MDLPHAIDVYFRAENSGDVESMSGCFAPQAIVRDESRTYAGIAAIKAWKAETKKKYSHTVEPLDIDERDGKTVVKARLTGTFPGSPITVEFRFTLEGGRITSLDIG